MNRNGPIFADFMKGLMNGATPATRELMNKVMNGIFYFLIFMPSCTCLGSKQRCLLIFSTLLCRCHALVRRKETLNDNRRQLLQHSYTVKRVHCLMDSSLRVLHHHSQVWLADESSAFSKHFMHRVSRCLLLWRRSRDSGRGTLSALKPSPHDQQ